MTDQHSLKARLLAATAAAALALAGCSGEQAEETTDTPAASTQAKETKTDLGGSSPINKPFKLADAEPMDVDTFFAMMSDEEDTTDVKYGSASFDESIGATVLEQVTTTDEDSVTTIGRVELYGFNEAHIAALKESDGSAPKAEVFRKVRMFDVSVISTDDAEGSGILTIGGLEIDGLSFGGVSDADLENLEGGAEFAAVVDAFDLGAIYIADLNVQGNETDGPGINVSIADARFGGFSGGELGAMSFTGLDYTINQSEEMRAMMIEAADPQAAAILSGPLGNIIMPENQRAVIETMTWDGMSFAGLLPYMESGEQPPIDARNLLSFGKIEAKDAKVYVNEKLASTTGYSVVDPVEFAWLIPTKIKSYSKDITMDMTAYVPDDQDDMLAIFEENGLNNVTGESDFLWSYDDKGGDAELKIDSVMNGFANFDVSLKTSNAVLETLHGAAEAGDDAAFNNVALNNFSIKIEDESLLNVGFAIAALQTGQDPVQLRAGAPLMINMGGAQFAQLNPAFPEYLAAVANWVGTGGSLEIAINPSEPVAIATIAATGETAPQTLPDVLNLSVTHAE